MMMKPGLRKKRMEQARLLLKKAETTTPEEALVCQGRAAKLMMMCAASVDDLTDEDDDPFDGYTHTKFTWRQGRYSKVLTFASVSVLQFFPVALLSTGPFSGVYALIIAGKSDAVHAACVLLDSLENQMFSSMGLEARSDPHYPRGGDVRAWKMAFMDAWWTAVGRRVSEQRSSLQQEEPGTEVALRNGAELATEYVRSMRGGDLPDPAQEYRPLGHPGATTAGRRAGERAVLNTEVGGNA